MHSSACHGSAARPGARPGECVRTGPGRWLWSRGWGIGEVDDVSVLPLLEGLTPDGVPPGASHREPGVSCLARDGGMRLQFDTDCPVGGARLALVPGARAPGFLGSACVASPASSARRPRRCTARGVPRRASDHPDRRRSRRAGHRRRGQEGGRGPRRPRQSRPAVCDAVPGWAGANSDDYVLIDDRPRAGLRRPGPP